MNMGDIARNADDLTVERGNLVLSRKKGESVYIGDDIVLTVIRVGEHNCRLGVSAPKEMSIVRDDANERAVE